LIGMHGVAARHLFQPGGHALLWDQAFLAANPRAHAMDLFTRTGCAP